MAYIIFRSATGQSVNLSWNNSVILKTVFRQSTENIDEMLKSNLRIQLFLFVSILKEEE